MKKTIKEYWQLALALLVIAFVISVMCCSCKAPDHLRETTKMVQVDTVYISSVEHDTIKTVEVVHDSVDRVVERTVYVDSNGIVHEKEVERLTRIIDRNAEQYKATNQLLNERIAQLREQLEKSEKVVIKEVKVYVWWPCWVVLGIVVVLGLWLLIEHKFNNLVKKES